MSRETARIAEIKSGVLYKAEIDEALRKKGRHRVMSRRAAAADDAGPDARPRARAPRRRAADDPPSHARVLARARRRRSSCSRPCSGRATKPLPVHTTGRGALEATICNLFSPGDEIAMCCNGKFGEMWAWLRRIVRPASCTASRRTGSATSTPSSSSPLLDRHPRIRAVAVAYGDTSTGVANDVAGGRARRTRTRRAHARRRRLVDRRHAVRLRRMGRRRRRHRVAEMSDVEPRPRVGRAERSRLDGDDDVAAAEELLGLQRHPRFHLGKPKPETPGTPPVHLVLQVAEALRMIHEEGVEQVYARHPAMARARPATASTRSDSRCSVRRTFDARRRSRRSRFRAASRQSHFASDQGARHSDRRRTRSVRARRASASATWATFGMADVERTLDAVRDALRDAQAPRGAMKLETKILAGFGGGNRRRRGVAPRFVRRAAHRGSSRSSRSARCSFG